MRQGVESYDQVLRLPVLAYRDIVPPVQDDVLGMEVAFCGGVGGWTAIGTKKAKDTKRTAPFRARLLRRVALSRCSRFRPLRNDLDLDECALALPALTYRDIGPDLQEDDELEIEVEF